MSEELLERLGVRISPELLQLALTHRSYSYENGGVPTNERLEFLGDSILGQAVTVMLYRTFTDLEEGDLAKRRASLVSTVALAEVARAIDLGRYVLLGRGEMLTGGQDKDSILADTMEAVIGATYLDCGGEVATAMVLRLIDPLLSDPDWFSVAMDPKTALQELAGRRGVAAPRYSVRESGPDHRKTFIATVSVGDVEAEGEGTSKKNAEAAAAREAYAALGRD